MYEQCLHEQEQQTSHGWRQLRKGNNIDGALIGGLAAPAPSISPSPTSRPKAPPRSCSPAPKVSKTVLGVPPQQVHWPSSDDLSRPPASLPVLPTCHPRPAHPALFSQRSAVSPTSQDGVPMAAPSIPNQPDCQGPARAPQPNPRLPPRVQPPPPPS